MLVRELTVQSNDSFISTFVCWRNNDCVTAIELLGHKGPLVMTRHFIMRPSVFQVLESSTHSRHKFKQLSLIISIIETNLNTILTIHSSQENFPIFFYYSSKIF